MVTGDGDWKARWNADKTVLENHTLAKAEDEKFSKHESSYAAVGYAFSPFVLGCFGGIGSQAARFLCTLAFLELRQHDALRERAGLAPLSPTDRSQFRARCFRQASTRISAALAKATVMRLTGAPSLPSPTYRFRASNFPGPADLLPPSRQLGSGPRYMICVTLFCTLHRTRFACDSRIAVCCFTRAKCKNVRQNLIPRATSYRQLLSSSSFSSPSSLRSLRSWLIWTVPRRPPFLSAFD